MKTTKAITMELANEISLVTIPVPHFWQYDVITSEEIAFRIYREDDWFKAVPQTSAEACKVSGLPEELVFVYANHVVLAANNMEEEALNVIKNIILELQVLDLL